MKRKFRCKTNILRSIKITKIESIKIFTDKIKAHNTQIFVGEFYQNFKEDNSFHMQTVSQSRKHKTRGIKAWQVQ